MILNSTKLSDFCWGKRLVWFVGGIWILTLNADDFGFYGQTTCNCNFDKEYAKVDIFTNNWPVDIFLIKGSPYYDNVRPLSYPDADAVLICFDISRPETLDSVLKKVSLYKGPPLMELEMPPPLVSCSLLRSCRGPSGSAFMFFPRVLHRFFSRLLNDKSSQQSHIQFGVFLLRNHFILCKCNVVCCIGMHRSDNSSWHCLHFVYIVLYLVLYLQTIHTKVRSSMCTEETLLWSTLGQ